MNQDFTLFKQRLEEAGMLKEQIESILEIARNSIYKKNYGLVWEEKAEKIKEDLKFKLPYLKEIKEREIKLEKSNLPQHLLIEGDNYESLKLLQTTHRGKVNIIYIDPPYNTGNNDFIYNDRIVDKEDGYRHSKWLSFMNKRLILAKELMSDDGIIFISIGGDEFAQLKLLCDEIFGEQNGLPLFSRVTKKSSNSGNYFSPCVDYVLSYTKVLNGAPNFSVSLNSEQLKRYSKKDKFFEERGPYQEVGLFQSALKHGGSRYPILCPDGSYVNTPDNKPWRWNEATFLKNKEDGRVVFKETKTSPLLNHETKEKSKWNIYTKTYLNERTVSGITPKNFSEEFQNNKGTKILREIGIDFDFAKPVELLKFFIAMYDKNITILDFFAGSGTTGHAVLELNQEDSGNRQFILCTNNENNICEEITYERLKHVINGYTTPNGKKVKGILANLKYLKVEMIDKKTYTSEDLSYLYMPYVAPLLQLKHNAYQSVVQSAGACVYEGNQFRFGVANDLASDSDFKLLIHSLKDFPGEKILYLFSTDMNTYPKHHQLHSLESIIQPIPREILNLLKGE